MKKKIILIAVIVALIIITAVIVAACTGSSAATATNTCVSCHTDEALLQQLTAAIAPEPESALTVGEC